MVRVRVRVRARVRVRVRVKVRGVGLREAQREEGVGQELLEGLVDGGVGDGLVLDDERHAALRDALVHARRETHAWLGLGLGSGLGLGLGLGLKLGLDSGLG